ncbi:hypothetical protein [Pararhizobium sp. DWP3-4]|uniref:hypothetical protein n=1 Tax=Pararhizobium sp. DWP3-4 TaxID=2804565 RepID=UPI003CED3755
MTDVTVDTGPLNDTQTQIARAVMSLLEGFEYEDALAAMMAVLAGCVANGSTCAREARTLAEALGEALVELVEDGRS